MSNTVEKTICLIEALANTARVYGNTHELTLKLSEMWDYSESRTISTEDLSYILLNTCYHTALIDNETIVVDLTGE